MHLHVSRYVPAMPKHEMLPMTLQVHPELLADERTVEEYTWHMTSSPDALIGICLSNPCLLNH